mmetsp:Transcript_52250/g.127634  ORF Transcript_52250/g.127634 Transcript_52250/m.127634 type:complete len:518 (-) Transcript_52250:321-1874(-)
MDASAFTGLNSELLWERDRSISDFDGTSFISQVTPESGASQPHNFTWFQTKRRASKAQNSSPISALKPLTPSSAATADSDPLSLPTPSSAQSTDSIHSTRGPGERRARFRATVLKTKEGLEQALHHRMERLHQKMDLALDKARARAKIVSRKLARPEAVIERDKYAFTAGLAFLIFTEYVFLKQMPWVKAWYTLVVLVLYGLRYIMYHTDKLHYFLIDFCYVINLLLLFTLHLYPNSQVLFKLSFALSTGPVPVAIIAWRNSLVFHSLDKVTSVVIHLLPCGIVYCMRWFPEELLGGDLQPDPHTTFYEMMVRPFIVYFYWQIAYILKTQVVDRKRMSSNPDVWTSARWLSRHRTSKGFINKFINSKGTDEDKINLMMSMMQLIYTALTLLPICVLYESFIAHTIYLIVICWFCVHNGAGYYFEVFSRKYIQEVMIEHDKQEIGRTLSTETGEAHHEAAAGGEDSPLPLGRVSEQSSTSDGGPGSDGTGGAPEGGAGAEEAPVLVERPGEPQSPTEI